MEYDMAVQEIRRGRDLVLRLQEDLLKTNQPSSSSVDDGPVNRGKIVEEVLLALDSSISVLSGDIAGRHEPAVTFYPPVSSSTDMPDQSSGDRRLSFRRKRDGGGINREQVGGRRERYRHFDREWTGKPFDDDGFMWKKYGQKKILGAKHQRMYYRCSQSADQGCKATKQVQMANDNSPSLFAVTRIGIHTCQKVIYATDENVSSLKKPFTIYFGSSRLPSSSTNSSIDSSCSKREGETKPKLVLLDTTFSVHDSTTSSSISTKTRSSGEFQELPEMYLRSSVKQSVVLPLDLQSPACRRTSGTDFIDFRDFVDQLLLQEQDYSCF